MATGLFGLSPSEVMQQRNTALQAQAQQYAQLDPLQRASSTLYQAGGSLAGALGGMFGLEDPTMKRAKDLQDIAQQSNLTTPEGMAQAVQTLMSKGYANEAMALNAKLQDLQQQQSGLSLQKAQISNLSSQEQTRLEDLATKKSSLAARIAVLKSSGNAATDAEAEAIASDTNAFREAMGLTKKTTEEKMKAALQTQAESLYPNDPVKQYSWVQEQVGAAQPLTATERVSLAETAKGNVVLDKTLAETNKYLAQVSGEKPEVTFDPLSRGAAVVSGGLGIPTKNAIGQSKIVSHITAAINDVLNSAKGVQAKDDAARAKDQILGSLGLNSNEGVAAALTRLKEITERTKASNEAYDKALRKTPASSSSGAPPVSRLQELLNKASPEQRKALGK